jgi:hypothetical protein
MSLVDNIAGKGFPPVPWLTLACSSVTTGIPPRICRVAIFRKAPWMDLMRRSAMKWREGRPRHRVMNAPLDTCQRSPDQGAGRDTASEALAAQACVDAFFEAH